MAPENVTPKCNTPHEDETLIERERCAKLLENITTPELLLMAGEMSEQELLTVKAVLGGMSYLIRYPR